MSYLRIVVLGNEAPYCAHPDGAMERQGVNAAWNAAHMAAAKTTTPANMKAKNIKVYTQLIGLKGNVYLVEEGDLDKLQTLSNSSTPASFAGLAANDIKWEGWMVSAEEEEEEEPIYSKTSVD
ncbi:hypothetical protein C0989_004763 [Termitomyces sp. Mn162]|nr:hypothetical protein C0989_004763 [Termitomyces sp. Mn162]